MTTLNNGSVRVASSNQIEPGGRLVIAVGGMEVGIFRVGDDLCAFENRCPHAGGPVCQGTLIPGVKEELDGQGRSIGQTFDESDPRIVCPWHGYEYSLLTGEFPNVPNLRLRRVEVSEENGEVYLHV